jgi:dihydroorotase-like cyclic amidohydrolase
LESLKSKQKLVENKAYVDYIFNIAVFDDQLNEIEASAEFGVKTFAFFDELDGKNTGLEDAGTIFDALLRIKNTKDSLY